MRGTMLLVHGDKKSRQLLYKILRSTQCEIELAESIQGVQQLLASRHYDLAVLDFDKAESEGVTEDALARLAARHGNTVRFFIGDKEVAKLTRAQVGGDGTAGLRINHNLQVQVSKFEPLGSPLAVATASCPAGKKVIGAGGRSEGKPSVILEIGRASCRERV